MSDNINFDYKNLSPFKWFVLENFPFIEADFDALTEWQLFCKIGKEINKIIDSQNIVGEQAENLTNSFNTLYNYVHNYLDNLDVQEEINNKLNEMAESGELSNIISNFLNLNPILTFNNVEEMKNANWLLQGNIVNTLGFYNENDEGGNNYIISNEPSNTIKDILLNNGKYAIAQIKDNTFNVLSFGVKADNETDNTEIIQNLINYASSLPNSTIYFPSKPQDYLIDRIILKRNVSIKGNGTRISQITTNNDMFVLDKGEITNNNYSLKIENIHIVPNHLNQNQVMLNFTALQNNNKGGGLWHAQIKDIIISPLSGNQIGLQLLADDISQNNIDCANQYLEFNNINIYRNSENAVCLNIVGQIGQTQFINCEFNGTDKTLQGKSVVIQGLNTSNDSSLLPLVFDNTTFQTANNPLYIDTKSVVVLNNCHFEQSGNSIIIDNRSNLTLNNCNFSSSGLVNNGLIGVGEACSLIANNITFYALNTNAIFPLNENADFRKIKLTTFSGEIIYDNILPYLEIKDNYKLYALNSNVLALSEDTQSNVSISEIHSSLDCSDDLTLINLSDYKLIINNNLKEYPDGIILPPNVDNIVLLKNQCVKLKRIFTKYTKRKWVVDNFFNNNYKILYNGETSLEQPINISNSINSFSYVEVIFKDDSNRKDSTGKISISKGVPNYINLHSQATINNTLYTFLATLRLNDTEMSIQHPGLFSQTTQQMNINSSMKLKILQVIGYY